MDHSCLLWDKNCDGSTGACLYYDNHHMAWIMLGICMSCSLCVVVSGLIGWQVYVYKHRKEDYSEDAFEITGSDGQTGGGETGNNYAANEDVAVEVHGDQPFVYSSPGLKTEDCQL